MIHIQTVAIVTDVKTILSKKRNERFILKFLSPDSGLIRDIESEAKASDDPQDKENNGSNV